MPDVLTAASDLGWPLVTRYLGIDLVDQLAPLAAATLLLEILGPRRRSPGSPDDAAGDL